MENKSQASGTSSDISPKSNKNASCSRKAMQSFVFLVIVLLFLVIGVLAGSYITSKYWTGTRTKEKVTCLYNGNEYSEGDTFKSEDGCNQCVCNDGKVACTLMECEKAKNSPKTNKDDTSSTKTLTYQNDFIPSLKFSYPSDWSLIEETEEVQVFDSNDTLLNYIDTNNIKNQRIYLGKGNTTLKIKGDVIMGPFGLGIPGCYQADELQYKVLDNGWARTLYTGNDENVLYYGDGEWVYTRVLYTKDMDKDTFYEMLQGNAVKDPGGYVACTYANDSVLFLPSKINQPDIKAGAFDPDDKLLIGIRVSLSTDNIDNPAVQEADGIVESWKVDDN